MRKKTTPHRGRYGDGCIYLRGKTWWITWHEPQRLPDDTITHQKCFESTGSGDKELAQRILRAKLQLIGGQPPKTVASKKVTYDDLRQNFLAFYIANNRRSLRRTSTGTSLDVLGRLDKYFSGWRAKDITLDQLNRFRAEGKREGLSDQRLNRYISALRKMFNQGIKNGRITSAQAPLYYPMVVEPNEAIGAIFIEREWYTALQQTLSEPLRSAFVLSYHLGVRVGELEQIRWRHVDVKNRRVHLPKEITKTSASRDVGLPSDFGLKPGEPDALVFPFGYHKRHWEWQSACVKVGAAWFACRRCGARCDGRTCPTHGPLVVKKLLYHGPLLRHCRHTAVRNMDSAGLSDRRKMDLSGHKTRAMLDRYNIGREKDVAHSLDVIEKFHQQAV